jgi:hypothetical protein
MFSLPLSLMILTPVPNRAIIFLIAVLAFLLEGDAAIWTTSSRVNWSIFFQEKNLKNQLSAPIPPNSPFTHFVLSRGKGRRRIGLCIQRHATAAFFMDKNLSINLVTAAPAFPLRNTILPAGTNDTQPNTVVFV